jgi:hypothetical protein
VCIDLRDGSALQSPARTALADVTFKRSYSREAICNLTSNVGSRVQPFGLTYMFRSGHERHVIQHWVKMLPSLVAAGRHSFPKRLAATSRIQLRLLAAQLGWKGRLPPLFSDMEASPDLGSPKVLFQTRAWDPQTGSDPADLEKLNGERVAIIRGLRESLGQHFVGGLVPTEFARKAYPDCLADTPSDKKGYLALVPQHDICISTTGLHRSNPWKLPEYLAASRAIVMQPLEFEIPKPLAEGVNVRTFATPEECVNICTELLDEPERRAAMKDANFRYYWSEQRPSLLMTNRLEDLIRVGDARGQ